VDTPIVLRRRIHCSPSLDVFQFGLPNEPMNLVCPGEAI
jgi:hypothetical protein